MGEEILQFYQMKLRKEYKIAFISTFLIAILIHLYKFANTLPNHDSVYNYYSDQNVLGSGRWALSWACGISSYWDLPWVNGLLSCFFIAWTVVVIVALFRLKNPVLIGLIGALLAASPATTETFFFLFTADGYMIAMLLAALAVYFSRMEEARTSRLLLSGVHLHLLRYLPGVYFLCAAVSRMLFYRCTASKQSQQTGLFQMDSAPGNYLYCFSGGLLCYLETVYALQRHSGQ